MSSALTTFQSQDDALAEWIPPVWSLHPDSSRPLRVLVAEPSPAVRRQVGLALSNAGMQVEFATSCSQALDWMAARPFDAMVVDPEMDGGRGLQLCRAAARPRQGPATPVVTLSPRGSWRIAARSRLAGARAHFARPVSLTRFVAALWREARARAHPTLELTHPA
jgi:DNA-binding response OmpR family regulator